MKSRRPLLALSIGLLALGSCKRDSAGVELSVFAASSLTEAFGDLESQFEAQNPGVDVRLTFAGSQVLRLQLESGANADVFASANEEHMKALVESGLVAEPTAFARNELVVIVPKDAPRAIDSFAQLPKAKRLVVGNDNVPIGRYTQAMLERARPVLGDAFVQSVAAHVVSKEDNVRLVRAKVELGEADAAIVYRTDASASDAVGVVEIPDAINVRASYPIGRVVSSRHPAEAKRFIAFIETEAGRSTLHRHGFATEAR
jgi:molybdate transport system substrate-binding protein